VINFIYSFLDLIFPSNCVNCQAVISLRDKNLCFSCLNFLRLSSNCLANRSFEEKDREIYYHQHFYLADYSGAVKNILQAYKFQSKKRLVNHLVGLALKKIKEENLSFDLISYVPMNRKKKWERGYNQSELLSRKISKKLGYPLVPLLKEAKKSKVQKKLSTLDRFLNVINRYQVTRTNEIPLKKILLIDDVFTTGATVNECSRKLIEVGAKQVLVLTIAKTNLAG